MKIVKLPDGKTIPFGVDTPDDVIDRTVKAYLGVEEGPDPEDLALMQLAQGLVGMQEQVNMLTQTVAMLQQNVAEQAGALRVAVDQMSQAASAYSARMEDVVKAITAPKAVTRDAKGLLVGVQTVLRKGE